MSFSSSKTPGTLTAEIEMLKTTHRGGFLVVEGDDDSIFWRPRTHKELCEIIIAGGKPNVIGVAAELDRKSDNSTIGCYDADFEIISGKPVPSPRLARTDIHDLELMLLTSGLLDRVLIEICDYNKVKAYERATGLDITSHTLKKSVEFGLLRYINEALGLNVSFDSFSPYKYIDHTAWSLDIDKLRDDFCTASGLSRQQLQGHLDSTVPHPDPLHLSQGHDTLKILAIGLKSVLGGNKSYSDKEIASRLRIALDDALLHGTGMYAELKRIDGLYARCIF